MVSHILSKSHGACDTWMKSQGFYLDSAGNFDHFDHMVGADIIPSNNTGFIKRQMLFQTPDK